MKFPTKQSADFTPVPAGNHVAICNAVVDLGWQKGSTMYPDPKPQVYIRFELPNERLTFKRDDKTVEGPMVIGRIFTASMNKKSNLRAFVESFYARKFSTDEKAGDFDLTALIGNHCMLNVTQKEGDERTYSNVAGVAPVPKGMKGLQGMENEPLAFDLSKPNDLIFQALPKWLREKIDARVEEPVPKVKAPANVAVTKPSEDFVDDDLDKAF